MNSITIHSEMMKSNTQGFDDEFNNLFDCSIRVLYLYMFGVLLIV